MAIILGGSKLLDFDRNPVTKACLVKASLLKQLTEAEDYDDQEEIARVNRELEYLEAHRSEY